MTPARLRVAGSVVVLATLLVWLGPGPFVSAAGRLDARLALAALALGAVTTVAAAWRWRAVATALDAPVPLGWAVAAYYRSQFLNSVLPGGVLGDVHRGLEHGRGDGRMSLALRAVVWERIVGQAVAVAVTLVAVLAAGASLTPLAGWLGLVACVLVAVTGGLAWLARRRHPWPLAADVRRLAAELRPRQVIVPSVVATLGHAVLFTMAAQRAAPSPSWGTMLALALVVLALSAVPVSMAGWGPREVATGALFPLVGATTAQGVEASVVYGLLALVATLPGAAVLAVAPRARPRRELEVADA